MKIAVTYENGQVFQHFGHTEYFKIYEVMSDKVKAATVISTNGSGHGALAEMLKQINVDTLICGGIGGGARTALDEAGIKIYGGVSGDCDKAVESLLIGNIDFNPNARCDHHGENHDGACSSHGCAEHHCGE